jgi:hypothetical protein
MNQILFACIGLLLFSNLLQAQETSLKQNLDPQPIIAVDGNKAIDTEASSPIAPQSEDGFGGVVQEPFAPTESEKLAIRKKRQEEEQKQLQIAQNQQKKPVVKKPIARTRSLASVKQPSLPTVSKSTNLPQ